MEQEVQDVSRRNRQSSKLPYELDEKDIYADRCSEKQTYWYSVAQVVVAAGIDHSSKTTPDVNSLHNLAVEGAADEGMHI